MRSLLFVLLVACGGGSKSTPPPVANQPPTAAQPIALASPCTDHTVKCAMATLESYRARMCNCQDKACAEKTNEEMTIWGTALAKDAASHREKPDPEISKRAADVMTTYVECMTKLMGGPPPPDPCAGGTDPCGG